MNRNSVIKVFAFGIAVVMWAGFTASVTSAAPGGSGRTYTVNLGSREFGENSVLFGSRTGAENRISFGTYQGQTISWQVWKARQTGPEGSPIALIQAKEPEVLSINGISEYLQEPEEALLAQIPEEERGTMACLSTKRILLLTPEGKEKPETLEMVEEHTMVDGHETETVTHWRLTWQGTDTGISAALAGASNEYERNSTIRLRHNPASMLEGATQVSALITDSDHVPLYYGRINDNVTDSESGFTIPEDMPSGSYRLYAFAEAIHREETADYASAMGKPITIIISQTETPVITQKPYAEDIVYGQSLSESVVSGGNAFCGSSQVEGTFKWVDPFVIPKVSDSGTSGFRVQFVPKDKKKYNSVTTWITLQVTRAKMPESVPETDILADYSAAKVAEVPLPKDWVWQEEAAQILLEVGETVEAVAYHREKENYIDGEKQVTITRQPCTHNNLTDIIIKNREEAICTQGGYSGEGYCASCGIELKAGKQIEALGHRYQGEVTKTPSVTREGTMTYTCIRCGDSYTEVLQRYSHKYSSERVKTVTRSKP